MYMSKKFLFLFCLVIVSSFIYSVYYKAKAKDVIKDIGSFEYEGMKTQVIQAGDCKVFLSKWKSENDVKVFFNCPRAD